jgi:hypothetical protein
MIVPAEQATSRLSRIDQLVLSGALIPPTFEGELPDHPHPIPSGRTVEELIADVSSDH